MLKNRIFHLFFVFCKRITNLSTKDMILQFKVKNFLSIREEQTLDFTASADKTYEDYAVVKIKGVRISKLGVVYGPNASGKSNILKALAWFIFYLVASRSQKPCTGTGLTPFMMYEDTRNQNSSFELIFYIGDVRYEYSVVLNNQKIYKEELYFYPNNRRALFYERTWNETAILLFLLALLFSLPNLVIAMVLMLLISGILEAIRMLADWKPERRI